jgi:hypothetical protein
MMNKACPVCGGGMPHTLICKLAIRSAVPCPHCKAAVTLHPVDRIVNAALFAAALAIAVISMTDLRGDSAALMIAALFLVSYPVLRLIGTFFRLSVETEKGYIDF